MVLIWWGCCYDWRFQRLVEVGEQGTSGIGSHGLCVGLSRRKRWKEGEQTVVNEPLNVSVSGRQEIWMVLL